MRRRTLATSFSLACVALAAIVPAASAKEEVLTLYSPKITSQPYVHDSHTVSLKPDGREAPAKPGYITAWKEQALVDSKNPKAKPLPIAKMMVHHFLYFAAGACRRAAGQLLVGRGLHRRARGGAPVRARPQAVVQVVPQPLRDQQPQRQGRGSRPGG